jgi:DNA-binding GntR family transcriptional regulator
MGATEISRFATKSAVETVADDILDLMRQGQIAPGQRLVEADIAARFDVARTTVREALQRLEAKGFLSQERHRGFIVRPLSRARLREIYDVRAALDAMAAQHAAPAIARDPAALDALDTLIAAMDSARAAGDMAAFTQLNARFHHLIRERADNRTLVTILEQLDQSVYHMQFRLLVERAGVFASQDDHQRLYGALRLGDGDTAAREAADHAHRALAELLKLPDVLFCKD